MARNSRSQDVSSVGSVAVVSGSIRAIDDPDALDVKLSIWDTEVTMRADGAELGNWPAAAVTIRPIDAVSFEFAAEGDRLIFVPKDPDDFAQHPIVSGGGTAKKRRRSRKSPKAKTDDQPTQLRWDESTEAEERHRTKNAKKSKPSRRERRAAKGSVKANSEPDPQKAARRAKPPRREKAAGNAPRPAPSADVTPAAAAEIQSVQPDAEELLAPSPVATQTGVDQIDRSPVVAGADRTDPFGPIETPLGVEQKPPRARRAKPAKVKSERVKKERPKKERVERPPKAPEERFRHRAWIWLIDVAREYDVFGLDRVQITEAMRADPDHSHTWNSRVAPTSGPGKYICTACGAIRRDG